MTDRIEAMSNTAARFLRLNAMAMYPKTNPRIEASTNMCDIWWLLIGPFYDLAVVTIVQKQ